MHQWQRRLLPGSNEIFKNKLNIAYFIFNSDNGSKIIFNHLCSLIKLFKKHEEKAKESEPIN
jgi:hypothetical protein